MAFNTNALVRLTINKLNYFGDQSNLHGVRYVFSERSIFVFKRCIWLIFLILCCLGVFSVLRASLGLYQQHAVGFSVETSYLHWETAFPAVTICETIDNDKLGMYLEDNDIPLSLTSFYRDVAFVNEVAYCRSCGTCSSGKTQCPVDVAGLARDFRSSCRETITKCWWNEEQFDCCDRFHVRTTEFGNCFVFNSRLSEETQLHTCNRKTGPGTLNVTAMESVTIDIHSPDDISIINSDKQVASGAMGELPFVTEFILKFKVEETVNDPGVRSLSVERRGCFFPQETAAAGITSARYSYTACILECRAIAQVERCNCTHHLMPRYVDDKTCDIKGLICLTDMKDAGADEESSDCNCLPSCEETQYDEVQLIHKHNTGALTEALIDRGTLITVQMVSLPTMRVRRHVTRTLLGFVVDVGGIGGVFFGASILSFIEVIYLLCLRTST